MGHLTNSSVKLQLTPTYKTQPPKVIVEINGYIIFNGKLTHAESFNQLIPKGHSLKLKIKRSGRNKEIITTDQKNGFTISDFSINGIEINPDIGTFQCRDNDYLDQHYVHGKHFTLNGDYFLEIPYYTLRGEITKNKDRFNTTDQHHKYCFFGASMTDYDFIKGKPPIYNKKNYADLFIQKLGGKNLASSGQTNQEIFETVYTFLKTNKVEVCLVQLIGVTARQVKDADTKEIYRWSAHMDNSLDHTDEFTQTKLKAIQQHFVYLTESPILALQIPEYKDLIEYAENRGSKIFFTSYFLDEYKTLQKVIPNNMAPYFHIDPNTKYCRDNGHHATPEEQENYFQSLVDFVSKVR